jgi:hypothetical protein
MKNQLLKNTKAILLLKRGMLSLTMGLISFLSFSQTTYTIGTGAVNNPNFPISSCYGYTYSQQIYTAADLTAQGAVMGTITKLRFFLVSKPAATTSSDNWKVYLGNTNKDNFASTTDWETINNSTLSFDGAVTIPAANNWMEITLSTPFNWDGVSNIIISVEEEDAGFNCTINWKSTTGSVQRGIYYRNDATNPNPASPPTALATSPTMPNVQFDIIAAPICAGTPVSANTLASLTDVCPTGTTILSASDSYFEQGLTKQWQVNDGTGWIDIPGATNATLIQTNLVDTLEYQLIATCINSGMSTITTPITVNLQENPILSINSSNIATCLGEPANVIASGAATYSWAPATGLNITTGDAVLASPTSITTYTVTGTNTFGCVSTITSKVSPVTLVKGELTTDPIENCTYGSPVTLTLSNLTPEITSNGIWETRWLASDSVTVLQDWNVTNTYTFIPTVDSVYGHFYQIRSTSCPSDYVDSIYTSVAIGFGAEATLIHYDCNTMGGTISMYDVFGQPEIATVYSDTLNVANSALVLTGNAAFVGGRVELTPSATSKSGSLTITPPNFVSGVNNSLKFNFTMTADMPINTFGTGGGDGVAFSFGNDAVIGGVGPYQNGKGSKLRLVFDAANNANGNVAGIYLSYGFNTIDMAPASSGVLAYSNNISLWKTQTDVPVEINIDVNSKVTVTVGGTVIFANIQLPATYKNENVTTWKHLFTALTGGDALRQAVKDYSVSRNGMLFGITDGGSSTEPSVWQVENSFTDLLPGTYDVWMSKDTNATCLKNVGTYEILNNNPTVNFGNDTTICEGTTITLNAGNDGAVYVWSNSNQYTQSIDVNTTGNYVVNVTDTNGCTAIGSIVVTVNDLPSATGIYAQGVFPNVTYAVLNAQNTDSFAWNFGDGQTLSNGPSTITHTYTIDGELIVTATLTNDCGSVDIIDTISLIDYTSLAENSIDGLSIYPNPTSADFTVRLTNTDLTEVKVLAVSGAIIETLTFNEITTVSTENWVKGIYFLHLTNSGTTTVKKLIVQ